MAVKFKQDKNTEFKSLDRDIREHELSNSDFDLVYTDSTCPFAAIIDEIKQPGEEYLFALNSPERINKVINKKWYMVSPDRLKTKRSTYRADKREENDSITTGDTIVFARDKRYGESEDKYYNASSTRVMHDTLQRVRTDAYNPLQPFSDKSYRN